MVQKLTAAQQEKLGDVTAAQETYRAAKERLERELRDQLKEQLTLIRDEVDLAIRRAVVAGVQKARIVKATGFVGWTAINEALARTEGMELLTEADSSDRFRLDEDDYLVVDEYGKTVVFEYLYRTETNDYMFFTNESVWNEEMTERNRLVEELDSTESGKLWEDANEWMERNA